jgi:hypothetical protein
MLNSQLLLSLLEVSREAFALDRVSRAVGRKFCSSSAKWSSDASFPHQV